MKAWFLFNYLFILLFRKRWRLVRNANAAFCRWTEKQTTTKRVDVHFRSNKVYLGMQLCSACVHLGMARLYSFTHLNVATSFQSRLLQPGKNASKRKQTGPQGIKNCSDHTHRHTVSWIDFCRCFRVDSPLHGVESSLWETTAHEQKTKTVGFISTHSFHQFHQYTRKHATTAAVNLKNSPHF